MCGIFGYFDHNKSVMEKSVLQAMGKMIAHRGPDDHGIFHKPGVALGNQRLSIIDLDQGHQPFVSEDGQIAVVQNGEIYNYIELAKELAQAGLPCKTHSDTEVLLRLYERDGIDFIHKLNGMFAIAIYDGRSDEMFLVRDRIGVKPLYLYERNGRILFASEIKSILAAGIPREMDPEALYHFLTYNYVPPPFTMFKGIRHLMPGEAIRIGRGHTHTFKWWDLGQVSPQAKNETLWIEEFNSVLEDAVRLRLRSDVPFGAFLSGGVDSSSVVGYMAQNMTEPVNTFCIGFNEKKFDESPFAKTAAELFGTHHVMEKVDPNMMDLWPLATYFCDQPHGDVSFLPTYRVAELAVKHVKVVLTGDGGDELFAGYTKYRDFFGAPGIEKMNTEEWRRAYYRNITLFDDEAKARLFTPEFSQRIAGTDSFGVIQPLYERSSHQDRINQALFIDMMLLLPGNNLVKPDRMGMAVSLEARTPFLDYRMMELAFRMPGDLKLRNGETKYLFKKAVVPMIGESLAYREKQMFTVPVGEWLKNELAEFSRELLTSPRFVARGLFDPGYVSGMLNQHQSGKANFTREIRALIAIEMWFRLFLDVERTSPPKVAELLSEVPLA
jgi:asparagine synthase (glutamine-hydrolysing)